MSEASETTKPNERSYFRVRCRIAIRARSVRADEIDALEHQIREHVDQTAADQLDPDVAAWLDRIERKLDRLLIQSGADGDGLRPSSLETVVLSGGGIRLHRQERYEIGSVLLLEFELPGPPAHPVRCLACVVAIDEDEDGGHQVALTYRAIHASDREAIVRHTLAVERGERLSRADERIAS